MPSLFSLDCVMLAHDPVLSKYHGGQYGVVRRQVNSTHNVSCHLTTEWIEDKIHTSTICKATFHAPLEALTTRNTAAGNDCRSVDNGAGYISSSTLVNMMTGSVCYKRSGHP